VTLIETWTKNDLDIKNFLKDYDYFSVHGKRKQKYGRTPGGIVTLIKKDIVNNIELLLKCDYGLFFKLDKHKFGLKQHVILCCVYIPCEGSTFYVDRPESDGIAELESFLVNMVSDHGECDLFVMGDLNARTRTEEDYILDDDVTYIPGVDEWYVVDGFRLPRRSRDNNIPTNTFGRSLLDLCRVFGIHILNGRFPGDRDGEYTFVARTGKSVVDYMLASSSLFDHVINFQIDSKTESDHFPLVCELSCHIVQHSAADLQTAVRPHIRFKWNEANRDGF
jgi:exonuclease III